MSINSDKPLIWKEDVAKSVDLFNTWFMMFAPTAYRETRVKVTEEVLNSLKMTENLRHISSEKLLEHPKVLKTFRMCTLPPLARDRLIGLAYASKSMVEAMEDDGRLPSRMAQADVVENLNRLCGIISKMLDVDIFPWLAERRSPTEVEAYRASTIVADRLCGAVADPIVRNAQEERQLLLIKEFLVAKGYKDNEDPPSTPLSQLTPGTFMFRFNIKAGRDLSIRIPIDVVIVPKVRLQSGFPILIEAKSAGDFTNTNKRRKEEATKIRQLEEAHGPDIKLVLFLCGYFDTGYLGYEAAEGLDWVWEHRIDDLALLGI
ncbi:XamI family restriction endonuclease [bacterium]|nr:XamI family restriction endonuclease [bacterium]